MKKTLFKALVIGISIAALPGLALSGASKKQNDKTMSDQYKSGGQPGSSQGTTGTTGSGSMTSPGTPGSGTSSGTYQGSEPRGTGEVPGSMGTPGSSNAPNAPADPKQGPTDPGGPGSDMSGSGSGGM